MFSFSFVGDICVKLFVGPLMEVFARILGRHLGEQ